MKKMLWSAALALAAAACADAATAPLAAPGEVRLNTALTLSASPSSPASGDTVWVTASVSPSGSYYYQWTVQQCVYFIGEPEADCKPEVTTGAQNWTQRGFRASSNRIYFINVEVKASSTSATLAGGEVIINGLTVHQ